VDNKACNRAAIEALIKAGAFDSMGYKRSQLFQMVDAALKAGQGAAVDAAKGQGNLFGGDEDEPITVTPRGLPTIPEWTDKEKSDYEKEVLGFYLSANPFLEFADAFAMLRSHECSVATILPDKTQVVLAGIVSSIKIATDKNSKKYGNFTLEDTAGSVRSIMWADPYAKFSHLIKSDSVVIMRGRMDRRRSVDDESADGNFIADEVFTVDEALKKLCRGFAITLDEQQHTPESVESLLKILRENPGGGSVELFLRLKDGATATFHGGKTTASVTPALYRRLTEFLGADSAKVVLAAKKQSRNL
jgi:DNA polymerase-3 subunit alpha